MRLGYNTNGLAHHRLLDAIALLADEGYESVALTLDAGALDPYESPPALALQVDSVRLGATGCPQPVTPGRRARVEDNPWHPSPLIGHKLKTYKLTEMRLTPRRERTGRIIITASPFPGPGRREGRADAR